MNVANEEGNKPVSGLEAVTISPSKVLGDATRAYRSNARVFVGVLGATAGVPVLIAQLAHAHVYFWWVQNGGEHYDNGILEFATELAILCVGLVGTVLAIVAYAVASAAILHAVKEGAEERRTSFSSSMRFLKPFRLTITGAALLWVCVVALLLVVLPRCVQITLTYLSGSNAFWTFLPIPACWALLIYLRICWLFVPHAIVTENAGVLRAIRRSFRLVGGSWWRVCRAYYSTALAVEFLIVAITSVVLGLQALLLKCEVLPFLAVVSIGGAASAAVTLALGPIPLIATVIMYRALRSRKGTGSLSRANR